MTGLVLLVSAVLVGLYGFLRGRRTRNVIRGRRPIVTDDVMHEIVTEGGLELDDDSGPLDEKAIREAEDAFWDDEWEDPEPWAS